MSRRTYEPGPLAIPPDVRPEHPRFLETLNERFERIGKELRSLRGLDGVILLANDIDMGGKRIINAKGAEGAGSGVITQEEADARYLRNIRAMIERELRKLPGITGGGGSGASTVYETTFTANTTIDSPVSMPNKGDTLDVLITQDGTGGWTLTWGTGFHSSVTSDVNGAPGKRTHYRFVAGETREWFISGEPWTEL